MQPPDESLQEKPGAHKPSLIRNIILNFGGRGILTFLSLISAPILIRHLGSQEYGVYVLALTLGGLLGVLDLGLSQAAITLLSHAWHKQDYGEIQRIISTALTLLLGIGLIGGGILAIAVPWMVTALLNVPPDLIAAARIALWLSTIGFIVNMWLAVLNFAPAALERYDLLTARLVIISGFTTVGTILGSLLGARLPLLVAINVGGAIIGLCLFYIVSRTLLPTIRFRPGFDRTSFRSLARFGAIKFVGSVSGILAFRFDLFAIGTVLGVNAVSFYAIPSNAVSRVFTLLTDMIAPLFPRASKMRGDTSAVRQIMLSGTRIMAVLAGALLITLFVYADRILYYWVGGEQGALIAQEGTATMRLLLAAFFIQALAAIPAIFCEALGKPEINNGFALFGAILHIPLVLLLVPKFGITGAGLALVLNSVAQTLPFIVIASRRIAEVRFSDLIGTLGRPLAAAVLTIAIGFGIRPFTEGLPHLIVAIAVLPLISLALAIIVGGLTRNDLAYLSPLAQRLPAYFPGRDTILNLGRSEQA